MRRLLLCLARGMTEAHPLILALGLTNVRFPFLLPDSNAISVTLLFALRAASIQLGT